MSKNLEQLHILTAKAVIAQKKYLAGAISSAEFVKELNDLGQSVRGEPDGAQPNRHGAIGLEEKSCWSGYRKLGTKKKGKRRVNNCRKMEEAFAILDDNTPVCEACLYETIIENKDLLSEAKYHGKTVPLNKPMRGDVKKFKVYVRDPKTKNIKKVNFGDKKMRIKKSNPKRRKSFRARHNCKNPGPRWKARYWSCRKW